MPMPGPCRAAFALLYVVPLGRAPALAEGEPRIADDKVNDEQLFWPDHRKPGA